MGIGLGCASPEALAVIGADGVDALTMRALATRLGVVPGALYRHVRNKEQLRDLVLDGVLAEVDCQVDHRLAWTERVKVLAHRLRTVLEKHPGIAGLLKTRDPLGPHSLALARGVPGTAARGRPTGTGNRPGLLPGLRLHPREAAQREPAPVTTGNDACR
jgi:AcrR family transcriptional regulator